MDSVGEHILKYCPSIKYTREYFMRQGIFIDTRDKWILKASKIAYLKRSDSNFKNATIEDREICKGSWIWCEDEGFGLGRVSKIFDDGNQCSILFNKSSIPVLCDIEKMVLIFDDKKRKIKLIY